MKFFEEAEHQGIIPKVSYADIIDNIYELDIKETFWSTSIILHNAWYLLMTGIFGNKIHELFPKLLLQKLRVMMFIGGALGATKCRTFL